MSNGFNLHKTEKDKTKINTLQQSDGSTNMNTFEVLSNTTNYA
jgi:hypothetical protein